MKRLKKVTCIAVSLLIAFSAVGCGKKKKGDIPTLTWYLPMSEQADTKLISQTVSDMVRDRIGANVELVCIDSSAYTERMTMNMASGTEFDLCFTGYVNKYLNAAENGGLLPLTDLLKKEAPKLYESIPDYAWEAANVRGEIYAVPNIQLFAPPTTAIFFNDLLEKYNFDTETVKSIGDVEPYLEIIKKNEPTMFPFRMAAGTDPWLSGTYEEITCGLGIRTDGSSSEVVIISETPEYKAMVDMLHKWYKKGYIRQDFLSCGDDTQDYNAGRYGMSAGGWQPGAEQTTAQLLGRDVTFVPIKSPYMSKSKATACLTGIGTNSKYPEKAIKLLEIVNTDADVMNVLALGIEGKHYTLDEDGKYSLIDGSGYKTSGAWLFGRSSLQLLAQGQADGVMEQTEELNNSSVKSPLLGFALDTSELKTLISQITAAASNYAASEAAIDGNARAKESLEARKAAGLDKLRDAVQKQVDAYWAEKK